MTICEVGYEVAPGIFSVNLICANTGENEEAACRDTAQRHAARRTDGEVNERLRKGMPFHMIDEEAERQYDPSFRE